jgi:hypothetical protein
MRVSSLVLIPLNAVLNPVCHLLVLLGAHHILHVSRIRVKVSHLAISTFVYLYTFSLAWLLQDAKINHFVLLPQCGHQSLHLSTASLSIRFKLLLLFLFLICL